MRDNCKKRQKQQEQRGNVRRKQKTDAVFMRQQVSPLREMTLQLDKNVITLMYKSRLHVLCYN